MLKLIGIDKTFYPDTVNEKKALNGLNLQLDEGDFVTIIGSNGAGKSTLFATIAGGVYPDSGQVLLDGRDVTYLREYKRSKEIGRLFQDPLKGTAPSMTIEENMGLAYMRAGSVSSAFARLTKEMKEYFYQQLIALDLGLEARLSSPVGLLSGGQRQALTLLMATMVTPKILLLDEHTAALDPATGEKVLNLTREIVEKNNITCLMITHNLSSSLALGNRTIMMDEGQIILDLKGDERKDMTVEKLLEAFKEKASKALDNDRMLLA